MQATQKERPSSPGRALARCRSILWQTVGLSVLVNLLMLAGPLFMLQVYDRILTSRSPPEPSDRPDPGLVMTERV